jgi:glycosyltransferase involved in cell wall biosynthesis
MDVWLLHIGEDLPVDGNTRPFRYSYLARALQESGHNVLRWAPTFRHSSKTQRFDSHKRVQISPHYAIQFVHAPGYRRNIGVERLRTYRVLDWEFWRLARTEPSPDLIVAAIPSLEWADSAVEYGRRRGVPVIIDVRDLWPDVFANGLPPRLRATGRMLFWPYARLARRACRGAAAIAAVSETYLRWGLRMAGRERQSRDIVVPLGFEPECVGDLTRQQKLNELTNRGIDLNRPVCVFAGLFERSYDLATVIDAARTLPAKTDAGVQFILCGDGSQMPALRQRAAGLRDVHLLGWVDAATLQAATSIAQIGLCSYAVDALQSVPNKPFEYMASRLAVVSSLRGELAEMLDRHGCGLTYKAADATALAHCIAALVNNPQRLAAMRDRSYATWSRDYRSSSVYSRFVAQLEGMSLVKQAA